MNYLSWAFALFMAILLVLYYILPQKIRPYLLLCGSLFFYCCFSWKYLPFLLFVALASFFTAKALFSVQRKKLLLSLCIGTFFLIWFVVKDLQWFLYLLRSAILPSFNVPVLSILVPIGISYYTLQAISYLVDVYKGRTEPEKNFFHYLLFLSYFPTIVQGPISRYDQLMPQLRDAKPCSYVEARGDFALILLGLVKKMVIADRLAPFVNTCFSQYAELQGTILYLGAVGYALQLYFDFSGCVDICRGASGLFGIRLVANFNRPYLARSIKEFWSRWHLSLISWLKDYIYIPLGGNRAGTGRKYLNLLLTFLVSGLWHGAGTCFLIWGALHGLYQIIEQATVTPRQKLKALLGIAPGSYCEQILQTLITFHLVLLGWIFFRSESVSAAFTYIGNMFLGGRMDVLFNESLGALGLDMQFVGMLIANIVAIFLLEHRSASQESAINAFSQEHLLLRWPVYWILIFDLILFGAYGSAYAATNFMYGGF